MSDNTDTPRKIVARAVQSTATEEYGLDGCFLNGFVVVAEWMTAEGARYLSLIASTGDGGDLAEWQVQGYLHNTLNGDLPGWTNPSDEDEPEDDD